MSTYNDQLAQARATRIAITINLLARMRDNILQSVSPCSTLVVALDVDHAIPLLKVADSPTAVVMQALVALDEEDMIAVVNEAYAMALRRGAIDIRKMDLVRAYVRWRSELRHDISTSCIADQSIADGN